MEVVWSHFHRGNSFSENRYYKYNENIIDNYTVIESCLTYFLSLQLITYPTPSVELLYHRLIGQLQ